MPHQTALLRALTHAPTVCLASPIQSLAQKNEKMPNRANPKIGHWVEVALALVVPALARKDKPVVDWLRTHAIPLQTPEASRGFADMQALKKVVGNARIVALGEATHGTREFFQLKHRMLEFLASEMGFTISSIEAN